MSVAEGNEFIFLLSTSTWEKVPYLIHANDKKAKEKYINDKLQYRHSELYLEHVYPDVNESLQFAYD